MAADTDRELLRLHAKYTVLADAFLIFASLQPALAGPLERALRDVAEEAIMSAGAPKDADATMIQDMNLEAVRLADKLAARLAKAAG